MSNPTRKLPNAISAFLVLFLLLLPAAYVLSVGPAYRAKQHGSMEDAAYQTLYRPLGWAADRSEFLMNLGDWYVLLWDGA